MREMTESWMTTDLHIQTSKRSKISHFTADRTLQAHNSEPLPAPIENAPNFPFAIVVVNTLAPSKPQPASPTPDSPPARSIDSAAVRSSEAVPKDHQKPVPE